MKLHFIAVPSFSQIDSKTALETILYYLHGNSEVVQLTNSLTQLVSLMIFSTEIDIIETVFTGL